MRSISGSVDPRLLIRINNVSTMYHRQNAIDLVLLGQWRHFPE